MTEVTAIKMCFFSGAISDSRFISDVKMYLCIYFKIFKMATWRAFEQESEQDIDYTTKIANQNPYISCFGRRSSLYISDGVIHTIVYRHRYMPKIHLHINVDDDIAIRCWVIVKNTIILLLKEYRGIMTDFISRHDIIGDAMDMKIRFLR